jgi:hypothetical protein
MLNKILTLISLILLTGMIALSQEPKILFFEGFEDTDFQSRGWYDHLKGKLSTDEHVEGSKSSLECKFLKGARGPEGGTPGRHLFEESEEVYLSYYVKYSSNYTGSNKPYHPHEFHFITNKDDRYIGPAFTTLTTYIEQNEGHPLLGIQDCKNIDQAQIGVDLTKITEERAAAGCNGSSDGYPDDCYKSGEFYRNGKHWKQSKVYFSDESGKYYKNDWHFIEAYFKLNSIQNGKGINDGIIKYWFDGELIINHEDVLLRTAENLDMKFNQFLIAPYIGDGSPVEQTMWIDNLTVATGRINSDYKQEGNTHSRELNPNPATDYIDVMLSRAKEPVLSVKVYDILGVCVGTHPLAPSREGESIRIDVSGLAAGVYFVRVGGRVYKFVKM